MSTRARVPLAISIVPELRLRYSVWTGVVTNDDALTAYGAMLDDPDFDATLNDLVDTSAVTRIAVSANGVWQLSRLVAALDARYTDTKVAIVVPSGAGYILARLYTFYREAQQSPAEHRVFATVEQALDWLELPRDAALPAVR